WGRSWLHRGDGQPPDVFLDDAAIGDGQAIVDDQVVDPAHTCKHVGSHFAVLRVIGEHCQLRADPDQRPIGLCLSDIWSSQACLGYESLYTMFHTINTESS